VVVIFWKISGLTIMWLSLRVRSTFLIYVLLFIYLFFCINGSLINSVDYMEVIKNKNMVFE